MKLRTYLVKRTIHMIITILIVLVLLFVLYRMMPGSAAATMMMNPRMTQSDIDRVLVRYGFGKWVDYPGQYAIGYYEDLHLGRHSVTVYATDDNSGQVRSVSTHFDVNAPDDVDYAPPRVLDLGVANASLGQRAEFYVLAHDPGTIRSVAVTIVCPNRVLVDDDLEYFTETFPLTRADDNRTDEANRTYYFSGFSTTLLSPGPGGNSTFRATFEVMDHSRNAAMAAVQFDATDTSFTETFKIWNLSANIPLSAGVYTYPNVGQPLSLAASAYGGDPSFSIIMPDGVTTEPITFSGTGAYVGSFTPAQNGRLTLRAELGELHADLPFPVNSVSSMPQPQSDTSAYPQISDLVIQSLNREGREILSPEYPFILKDLRLLVNVTAINSDGSICSNITAIILSPDGSTHTLRLYHPQYVQMRSMAEQFVIYMKTMLVFDFGTSYHYQRSAWAVILERVPSTMLLFGSAMIVSYLLGIMIGVVVAWRRGTLFEMSTIVVTLFFYSMPIFWFALIMQWIFYAQLGWFPLAGMGGSHPMTGEPLQGLAWFIDKLRHIVMPLITLVILGLAGTILLMRTSMLEVMGEDFTTTAKAKGLKERTVVYRHVARNALLPVVTSMAMAIGGIISGGVLTETIFSWYGMGTLLIEGTLQKDFPVVQGAFYVMALLTILGNMGADILYAWLDPRVQL